MVPMPMSMPACDIGVVMCSCPAIDASAGFAAAAVALGVAITAPGFALAHANTNGRTSRATAVVRLLILLRLCTMLGGSLGGEQTGRETAVTSGTVTTPNDATLTAKRSSLRHVVSCNKQRVAVVWAAVPHYPRMVPHEGRHASAGCARCRDWHWGRDRCVGKCSSPPVRRCYRADWFAVGDGDSDDGDSTHRRADHHRCRFGR